MNDWRRWLIVLLSVWMIACSPTPSPQAQENRPTAPPTAPVEIPAAPIEAITAYLSEQAGVPSANLQLERVEAVNWSDSCLGAAEPSEICAQAITPGFRVEFVAPQRRYVVHSDRTGRSIRLAPS
ncbi:MAG: hypothetical protein F6K28_58610 [Microcoleus sp. SIO2G3]|nr:hypothetical protein [Microcoleus sp. SIO2G3]